MQDDAKIISRIGPVAVNFWQHSGHVPVVLIILEALLSNSNYFSRFDAYLLLLSGVVQSVVSVRWKARNSQWAAFANFIGPLVYSSGEMLLEGPVFFQQWHHQAYWGYAICFNLLQTFQLHAGPYSSPIVVVESVVRSSIPLITYALFEARSKGTSIGIAEFMADGAHEYLSIVLLLLGLLLGFSEVALRQSQARVLALANRLREYSSWALGKGILEQALDDSHILTLRRIDRAVLFIDLRGFTAWSENQPPEQVVSMLNRFYALSEGAFVATPIKIKYTADEILAVMATPEEALESAQCIIRVLRPYLDSLGLSLGAGVHFGALVEGVLGGSQSKAYDVIGDVVNTAQRLCDAAQPWELLVSEPVANLTGLQSAHQRKIQVKGKEQSLTVSVLTAP